MDSREGIDDLSRHAANEYPDLDLSPSFLWVGNNNKDHLRCTSKSLSTGSARQLGETGRDDLGKEDSANNYHSDVSDTTASEDDKQNRWRHSLDDLDPDFEVPEDEST